MLVVPPPNIAHADHPVVRAIRDRLNLDPRKEGGPNSDPKLGLVVEGGGMRGVISGGALLAMEELGLTEAFDEVYAESAGAINASYFLAGQGSLGSRIYFEDIASARFINPLRVRRVLDLDYLIDEVMVKTKPLDAERVVRSRSRLLVSLTNAADGGRKVVDVRATRQPLLRILKATAAVIPLYNRAVELADGSYVDGGIADPIPVRNAIANGCTHILVLLTQPVGYRDRKFRGPTWLAARLLLGRKWDPRLVRSLFREKYRRYNASRDLALGYARAERSASIAVICPDGHSLGVARLTRDAERLRSALLTSKEHALKVFRGAG